MNSQEQQDVIQEKQELEKKFPHLSLFEPLNKVRHDLISFELEEQLSEYPIAVAKLNKLFAYYDQIYRAGNVLFLRDVKLIEKTEILKTENENLKTRIEQLEKQIEFDKQ